MISKCKCDVTLTTMLTHFWLEDAGGASLCHAGATASLGLLSSVFTTVMQFL